MDEEEKQRRKELRRQARIERKRNARRLRRLENKRKWRIAQSKRFYYLRKKKELDKQREMAGDIRSIHRIIITRDHKRLKTLKWCWSSIEANKVFNEWVAKNREEVAFPVNVVGCSKNRDHVKKFDSEILLVRKRTAKDAMDSVVRDSDGKIVRCRVADQEDFVIVRRERWYVEETFAVSGHHSKRDRKDYRFIREEMIIKGGTKRMFRFRNLLILMDDDGDVEYVMCKSKNECIRLYDHIDREFDDGSVIPCGMADFYMFPIIANKLFEKTGRTVDSLTNEIRG